MILFLSETILEALKKTSTDEKELKLLITNKTI